jgi:hypothetical protein
MSGFFDRHSQHILRDWASRLSSFTDKMRRREHSFLHAVLADSTIKMIGVFPLLFGPH